MPESDVLQTPSPWELALSYGWVLPVALILLLVAAYLLRVPLFVRLPLWILTHTFYRLRVHGAENLPAQGGALLVSNHVSYLDAMMIQAAQTGFVRFVIWAPFLSIYGLRWILRFLRVIPINGTSGPRAIIASLRTASDALAKGERVCIFAEGGITRTGFLLPFHRGLEQIVKKSPVPIVPVYIDHVWGSLFSYQAGKFFWKWPKQIPYHVYVNFGAPLPPSSNSFDVRQAIQRLSADSSIRRSDDRKPVHRQFVRMACANPWRACIHDAASPKPMLRYGELLAGCKITMTRLRPLLRDDPMVGVWLPPGTAATVANVALACLGKTSVNLNYTSSAAVVQSSIRQCGIRHVLTSRLFTHKVPLDPGPGVELVYLEDFRKTITSFERWRTMASVLLIPGVLQEYWVMGLGAHRSQDTATIIFSSGSTGDPKGVMLSHANIAANTESVIQAIDPRPSDCLLGILPFFHSFGYTVTLWLPLQVGASTVYHPNPLQAREIGELCKKHQCTIFLATPTFLRSYVKRCQPDEFRSVRILVCGAEKLPQPLAREFFDKFKVLPLEGYGCTELSPVAVVNVPNWEEGSLRQVGNKPGTIGHPIPGVAASIVSKEKGEPLPPGQEGLLLILGANIMKGYLGREDLSQKKLLNGWYITGDLAVMDEDGFITITGREERFAKVGGEMVPLERVEEELQQIVGSNERVLAVTAVPDDKKGERLVVLHLPQMDKTPHELWKLLNDRGLPNLYVPSQRDFFQVEELPILGSGKLDIKRCREKALECAKTAN